MSRDRRERGRAYVNQASEAAELYLDAIGREALERAGNNPQLKGIVHELLYRDKLNFGRDGLARGNVTRLTRNPRAHGVDLVTVDGDNRVVGRYQMKDCSSQSGVSKTLEQTRSGKYRSAKLMGTKETKKAYDAASRPTDKKMGSSGVSSKRTGRVADNVGVKCRDKNTFANNMSDVASCAGASALLGAAGGGVSSILGNYERYANGEIDGAEYAANVATDIASGGMSAGLTTAGALALKEGGKALGSSLGSETLKRVAGSNAATAAAFGIMEIGKDAVDLARGEIDGAEFGRKAVSTAGGAAGGYGGAAAGAALGAVLLPGVGAPIGALVGGLCGGLGGRGICEAVADWLFD